MQTEQMYQVSNAGFFRWRRRRGKISQPPLIFFMFFFTVWPCHRLRRYFHLRLTVCSDKIFFHTAFLISNRYHTKELPTPWLWWPQELHGLMFSILALFCAKSNWKCGSVWQFGDTAAAFKYAQTFDRFAPASVQLGEQTAVSGL